MPTSSPIDCSLSLANTIPSYGSHLLVSTGQSNWASKIEKDLQLKNIGAVNIAAELRRLLQDVPNAQGVMIGNSSFPTPYNHEKHGEAVEFHLFPQGRLWSKALPTAAELDNFMDLQEDGEDKSATTQEADMNGAMRWQDINSTTILICSHASRDVRCGILGPLLRTEFERVLRREGFRVLEKPSTTAEPTVGRERLRAGAEAVQEVSIGLVSHVGGHKWAGNVIIYFARRRSVKANSGRESRGLEGKGIWYGRVEPKHVEGLVKETVQGGRVIEELCRGLV